MPQDPISDYCDRVLAMVRLKRAHRDIAAELSGHMEDHAQALAERGIPPEKARRDAAAAMGDPYALGAALDKLHNPWYPRLSRLFCLLAALCFLLGYFVSYNASPTDPWVSGADPAALAAEADGSLPFTVLRTGEAVGGGQIDSYRFSPDGAAALVRIDTDYEGRPLAEPEYHLRVVFSSVTWRFWLSSLSFTGMPRTAVDSEGNRFPLWVTSLARNLTSRFYVATVEVDDPALREYVLEFGENHALVYSVTLGEEAYAP